MYTHTEDLIPFYELKERDPEDLVEEEQEDTASWPETGQDKDQDREFGSSTNPEDLIPFYEMKERDPEDLVEEEQQDTASWPETRQDNDQDRDFQRMDKHNTIT